jgi:hypothetical protein
VTPPVSRVPPSGWATSSLIAGLIWIILAVSPTFLTTLLGLPFAGYALVAGRWSRRNSLRAGDLRGARQAAWGIGLGCAGFVYLAAFYIIVGGAAAAALYTWLTAPATITPTP